MRVSAPGESALTVIPNGRPSTAADIVAPQIAAFAVQYVFWAIGLVGVLRHRRQLRARLARDGVVLAPLHVAVGARLRGTSAYR